MAFTVQQIVPWGRSLDEYIRMFSLSEGDLQRRILGCGDGPASFNAEATRQGIQVVSCDPLYAFSRHDIESRFEDTYVKIMAEVEKNRDDFVWSYIRSPQELGQRRRRAMDLFIEDYEAGKSQGRYVEASLPTLCPAEDSFDLALSSHFLFLYTDHLSQEFHLDSIREMLRVAGEARIFPLLAVGGRASEYVEPVSEQLRLQGLRVELQKVDYEFQRGGDTMMVVHRS